MNKLAPVCLFVYNRPEHTVRTIEALQQNILAADSEIYIFSDAPKKEEDGFNVMQVREYIKLTEGFKNVHLTFQEQNLGLAKSIISGVTSVLEKHNQVIVMEDDMVTSPNFLLYMNSCLTKYASNQEIYSISGFGIPIDIPANYKEDVYLSWRASSWGWGTWKDRWAKADWEVKDYNSFINDPKRQEIFKRGGNDLVKMLKKQMEGKIDSWAIRWCYTHFTNNAFCLHPVVSKLQNIGADASGVHTPQTNKYHVTLDDGSSKLSLPDKLQTDPAIIKGIRNFFTMSFIEKLKILANKLLEL